MNKKVIIASLAALLMVVASCQKDELDRLGAEKQPVSSDAKVGDATQTIQEDGSVNKDQDRVRKVDIMVKEVSDGDEESDDDEVQSKG